MKRSDNMVIPTLGGNYGIYTNHSFSVRGHLRPLDYDSGAIEFMRPDMLHAVGRGLGASGNTSNLCNFRLSYGRHKGEAQCSTFPK
jgi:hypothetical protein